MSGEAPRLPQAHLPSEPPKVSRSDEAIVELEHVRLSELQSLSERLDLVAEVPRSRKWESRSQKLDAALIGGSVALVPFLVEKPPLYAWIIYVVVLGVGFLISRLSSEAADDTRAERTESVKAIKQHIDTHMLATQTLPAASSAKPALPIPAATPPAPAPTTGGAKHEGDAKGSGNNAGQWPATTSPFGSSGEQSSASKS